MTTLIILYHIVIYILLALCTAYLFRLYTGYRWLVFLIVIPSLLTLFEWQRTFMFTGFPWYQPVDALWTYLQPLIPILGANGTNAIIFLGIVAAVYLLQVRRSPWLCGLLFMSIIIVTNIPVFQWTEGNKRIEVRIINGDKTVADKYDTYVDIRTAKKYLYLSAVKPAPDLVVWPESSIQNSYHRVHKVFAKDFERIQSAGTQVLIGSHYQEGTRSYNTVIDTTSAKPVYTKNSYVPFGEYIPTVFLFLRSLLPEQEHISSDKQPENLTDFIEIPAIFSICYDLLFAERIRKNYDNGLIHLHFSDMAWFTSHIPHAYMLNLARIRALEAQKPMVYAVNGGLSAFIDSSGNLLEVAAKAASGQFMQRRMQLTSGTTPYYVYGDNWLIMLVFVLFSVPTAILFIIKKRTRNGMHQQRNR